MRRQLVLGTFEIGTHAAAQPALSTRAMSDLLVAIFPCPDPGGEMWSVVSSGGAGSSGGGRPAFGLAVAF